MGGAPPARGAEAIEDDRRTPAGIQCYATGFDGVEWCDGEARGRIFISGLSGSGKSTRLAAIASGLQRATVIDTAGWFLKEGKLAGWFKCSQPGQLREYLAQNLTGQIHVLYTPIGGDLRLHFESVCHLIFQACRASGQGITLCVDEVDCYCDGAAPLRVNSGLYTIANYSRHQPMAFIGLSRSPQRVSRDLTSQCCEMQIYQTTEQRHINYFADHIGQVEAESLKRIPKWKYLLWRNDGTRPSIQGGPISLGGSLGRKK